MRFRWADHKNTGGRRQGLADEKSVRAGPKRTVHLGGWNVDSGAGIEVVALFGNMASGSGCEDGRVKKRVVRGGCIWLHWVALQLHGVGGGAAEGW